MDILIAAICDAANDSNGNLNMLGVFDTVYAAQFPAVHLKCVMVLRIVFSKNEEGAHEIRLTIADDDGHPLMNPIPLQVEVRVPEEAMFVTTNLVVHLQQLKFERAGHYSINISGDGRMKATLPLLVKPLPAQPGTTSSAQISGSPVA